MAYACRTPAEASFDFRLYAAVLFSLVLQCYASLVLNRRKHTIQQFADMQQEKSRNNPHRAEPEAKRAPRGLSLETSINNTVPRSRAAAVCVHASVVCIVVQFAGQSGRPTVWPQAITRDRFKFEECLRTADYHQVYYTLQW
jgi:hypothetical protein